jgi:hypothetical protein
MHRTAYAGDMHKCQLQETSVAQVYIPIKYQVTCANCVQESGEYIYFYIRIYAFNSMRQLIHSLNGRVHSHHKRCN